MGKSLRIGAFGRHEAFGQVSTAFIPNGIEGALTGWIPIRGEECANKWTLFLELTFVERESVAVRLSDEMIHVRATLLGDFWKPGLDGFAQHQGELCIPLPTDANPTTVTAHHFKDLLTIEVEKLNRSQQRSVHVSHSWSTTRI